MAVGLSTTVANELLDAIGNADAYSISTVYIQLHTADPGAAGTTAIAGNATRKAVSFGAASGGSMSNDAAITWSSGEVDTSEDYTHFSLWTASSAGTFIGSGLVTANAVTSGDTFTIPAGDVDLAFGLAA
jgi:hypothetical protein